MMRSHAEANYLTAVDRYARAARDVIAIAMTVGYDQAELDQIVSELDHLEDKKRAARSPVEMNELQLICDDIETSLQQVKDGMLKRVAI